VDGRGTLQRCHLPSLTLTCANPDVHRPKGSPVTGVATAGQVKRYQANYWPQQIIVKASAV